MTKPTNFCIAVPWRSPSASSSCSSWRSSVLGFCSISILAPIWLELLAQRQPLELVRRAGDFTIHLFGPLLHPLEEHLEEGLAVVDQERHVVRPYLQDDGRAVQFPGAVSEAGIEEAGVVRAQLAVGEGRDVAVEEPVRCVPAADLGVTDRRRPAEQAQLVEAHARGDPDREGSRDHLQVKLAPVARPDLVEAGVKVGDRAGEYV